MHSFEYAILRVVPRVEREEFVNVGVVLFCKTHKFLDVKTQVDERKVAALCETIDVAEIREYVDAFESITRGKNAESPIAKLDIASRFRWLTAARSTVLQTSKVHPGICNDPADKLEKLFREYVL